MTEQTQSQVRHLTTAELEAGLDLIQQSPKDGGLLQVLVRRPQSGERDLLQEGELDLEVGLVGDNWRTRGSSLTPDRSAHPGMQLTIMNSRAAQLVAQSKDRWVLAGDQMFVDMDISTANLPPGTQLVLGSAVIEVTEIPHTGCAKFVARFGAEAMKFVNSPVGKALRLRGVNLKVVKPGTIQVGDLVRKL